MHRTLRCAQVCEELGPSDAMLLVGNYIAPLDLLPQVPHINHAGHETSYQETSPIEAPATIALSTAAVGALHPIGVTYRAKTAMDYDDDMW